MKKIACIFLVAFFISFSDSNAATSLYYLAYKNSEITHSVIFNIKTTENVIIIKSEAKGETLKETTECIISSTSNQLISLDQRTKNETDNVFFNWQLNSKNTYKQLTFENLHNEKVWSEPWELKENSYPIQALLYFIQTLPLAEDYIYKCQLITPPKEAYPIQLKVIDQSTLTLDGKPKLCFKLEASVNHIFGLFMPKTYFWVTQEKPHIPIQYQDQRFIYRLRTFK
jgi:hypothetical protein